MQQAAGSETVPQPVDQPPGQPPLVRTHRREVPLRAVHVVDGDERRLAAHGQPDIVRRDVPVHLPAQRFDRAPLLVGVGQRHARIFVNPRHAHFVDELHFALVHAARYRRGRGRLGRRRQRDVPFARQQPRGRVQPDPARARQIDLGPGVQIGEVRSRARTGRPAASRRASTESDSRRRSARPGPDCAESPPAATPNRGTSRCAASASLRSIARPAPCGSDIRPGAADAGSGPPESRWCAAASGRWSSDTPPASGPAGALFRNGASSLRQALVVSERKLLRVRLQEKIERVDDGHLRHQIHLHGEVLHAVPETPRAPDNCSAGPAAS